VAVGGGVAAGVATTTSPSTTTTTSTETRTLGGIARRNCRVAGAIVTILGAAIAHRSSQLAVGAIGAEIPLGSTIPSIAAGPRIRIALQRTDSGARRGAILLRTVKLALGSRLADRVAICQAIGQVAWVVDRVVGAPAIEPVVE